MQIKNKFGIMLCQLHTGFCGKLVATVELNATVRGLTPVWITLGSGVC